MALTTDRLMLPKPTLFWVELVCARCSHTTGGQWVAQRVPVREMKKAARAVGWVFTREHSLCSKRCLKQFEACE